MEQVFAAAYADVEPRSRRPSPGCSPAARGGWCSPTPRTCSTPASRSRPGPPGKKVKRLSLLSGGERSLVAVAFLVAIFKARPSPFYVLDEVEAALDDTNLGRLLEIYEELRENSQLMVITHQKRTMEVGDALYGVTMRGDGVTPVISQRLREAEQQSWSERRTPSRSVRFEPDAAPGGLIWMGRSPGVRHHGEVERMISYRGRVDGDRASPAGVVTASSPSRTGR